MELAVRRAFTLIELLVVIAIIGAITIATVPMILPALDSRRIREASRIVSTHFASAQSEAIAKGRSVGIWIERLGAEPTAAMDLFLCEIPQPYAGSSTGSQAAVKIDKSIPGMDRYYFEISDSEWSGLPLRPGDLIRFNYRGPWFALTGDKEEYKNQLLQTNTIVYSNTVPNDAQGKYIKPPASMIPPPPPYRIAFDRIRITPLPTGTPPPYSQTDYLDCRMPPANSPPVPYQIYRQPVKSAASPVQMPGGTVIDLYFSSVNGSSDYLAANGVSKPVLIMFDKTGALDSVYWDGAKHPATQSIYLLIGKREKLPHAAGSYLRTDPAETQAEKHNFRDLENIWISIAVQTGLVSTTEVAQVDDSSVPNGDNTENAWISTALSVARGYATSAQTMGGR